MSRISWSRNETLAIIKLYQQYPGLYNSQHPDYKNINTRTKTLKKIHEELVKLKPKLTLGDIKIKINTLRNQLAREKRKHAAWKGEEPYSPALWFYEEVQFLTEHITTIRERLNSPSEECEMKNSSEFFTIEELEKPAAEKISKTLETSDESIFEYVDISSETKNHVLNPSALEYTSTEYFESDSIPAKKEKIDTDTDEHISKCEELGNLIGNQLKNIKLEYNYEEAKNTILAYIYQIVEKDERERQLTSLSTQSSENNSIQNLEDSEDNDFGTDKTCKTLAEFGFTFNRDGVLCKFDKNTGKLNNGDIEDRIKRMPLFKNLITDHVYNLLEKNGLQRVYISNDIPNDNSPFIFCTPGALEQAKKLLILINGCGIVRAGQWNKNLIINHSLDFGTQIPYIKRAKELGYEILITNANDNYRKINGKKQLIPGHGTPIAHVTSVWKKYVISTNPEAVAIVAHNYGGLIAVEMAQKFPFFFENSVFAIALLESVHTMNAVSEEIRNRLSRISRNYITSQHPLDEELSTDEFGIEIPQYSSGHTNPELTPFSCMTAIFDFFENKYEEINQ